MRPRLIHPVDVVVERIDRAATQVDADFREPVGPVRYQPPITIRGQVRYERLAALAMVPGGESPESGGHVLLEELPAGGLKKGDRIVSIAGQTVELYVTEIRPAAHYGGRARLVRVEFSSRRRG